METTLPEKNAIATHRQFLACEHNLPLRNLIAAARQALREEGLAALIVRRVAQALDRSTGIIYAMFKRREMVFGRGNIVACTSRCFS
jgi:hypothetical protein